MATPAVERPYLLVQAILAIATAVIAIRAALRMLSAVPVWNHQPLEWAIAAFTAIGVLALVARRWPFHAATAILCASMVATVAIATPGAVASTALLLASAWVTGSVLLAWVRIPADALIATLCGIAIWIGLFAMTRAMRVHFEPVHAGIAVAVLLAGRARVAEGATRAWRTLARPRSASPGEQAWMVLLGSVALLHVVVAAKPEVGYDAIAMHLQFAEHIARDHTFRFGAERYAWAFMPLGADYAFATAYLLGGEAAARLANLAFATGAAALVYRLARLGAGSEPALAVTTLFCAMPLAFLETASLFSEPLWLAFLLGALWCVTGPAVQGQRFLAPFALLCGGALATKAISLAWVGLLAPVALWLARSGARTASSGTRSAALVLAGLLIGAWPYVNAWVQTGNPVFPFMNHVFASALFPAGQGLHNPAYSTPLGPLSPWSLVLDSGRYLEARDGAMGLAGLFVLPLVAAYLALRRDRRALLLAALCALFFIAVFVQQAYLRYLIPAFALAAILAAWALGSLPQNRWTSGIVLSTGIALLAFDLHMIATAHHPNATPCLECIRDARARSEYVVRYAPLRALSGKANAELPGARIGFVLPNEPAPAGYVGYSRAANWHDITFFRDVIVPSSKSALADAIRTRHLTHLVWREPAEKGHEALTAFARDHSEALWRVGPYVMGRVDTAPGH